MKTLTLVRHAKSSWNESGLADRDRPLNDRGEQDAPVMGARLAASDIRPSLLVSSPALRAWTTARLIAAEIGYPKEFLQREEELYLADVDSIIRVLQQQDPNFNSVMLFGHNPGLTNFANYLAPDVTSNVPTCGVIAVDIETDDWDLSTLPACSLRLFDYPKSNRSNLVEPGA